MQSTGFKNGFILRISFISSLGGYLFGFDFAMIVCIVAGKIADKDGRRPGMMLAASLFAISSLAMALAPTRDFFMVARFMAGTCVGIASILSPMDISEIAPAAIRGRVVAMRQLT